MKKLTSVKELQRQIHLDTFNQLIEAKNLLNHSRAGKLLQKGKPFIVVADDEPYFLHVYRLIRFHEKNMRSWTEHCEVEFIKAVRKWTESKRVW